MQISTFIGPRCAVIILLFLICSGMSWLLFVVPTSLYRFVGICLIASGAFNVLMYRRFGRQNFDWAHSMPPFVLNFWDYIGKDGAQFLYLGIGVILATCGTFLLIRSL